MTKTSGIIKCSSTTAPRTEKRALTDDTDTSRIFNIPPALNLSSHTFFFLIEFLVRNKNNNNFFQLIYKHKELG